MSNDPKKKDAEVNLSDPQVWNRVMKNLLDEIEKVHTAIKEDQNNAFLMKEHKKELKVLSGVLDKLRENGPDPEAFKRLSKLESLGESRRDLPRQLEKVEQQENLKPKTLSAEIRKAEAEFTAELKAKEAEKLEKKAEPEESVAPKKDIDKEIGKTLDVMEKSQKDVLEGLDKQFEEVMKLLDDPKLKGDKKSLGNLQEIHGMVKDALREHDEMKSKHEETKGEHKKTKVNQEKTDKPTSPAGSPHGSPRGGQG